VFSSSTPRAHDRRAGADRRQRHQRAAPALDSLEEVFAIDPDTLHARFIAHARSSRRMRPRRRCEMRYLERDDIDAIVVSTCTGYLARVERVCHRAARTAPRPRRVRSRRHGCAAALPNWQIADALLAARPLENVLSRRASEVSSAAMYLDNDPGVLVSACLFGDGAGAGGALAAALRRQALDRMQNHRLSAESRPREALRFEQRGGMLPQRPHAPRA
jgi:alkylresorcinol/alkylpyrone synthase